MRAGKYHSPAQPAMVHKLRKAPLTTGDTGVHRGKRARFGIHQHRRVGHDNLQLFDQRVTETQRHRGVQTSAVILSETRTLAASEGPMYLLMADGDG